MLAIEIIFWASVALLLYTHVGYPVLLWVLSRIVGAEPGRGSVPLEPPPVTLIVAAHNEEEVIGRWVSQALALDYPTGRVGIVVVCDGCTDHTAARAREAGAHRVLELDWVGKVAALNTAAAEARGEVLAFADANAIWEPDALRRLVGRLEGPDVAYVCGHLQYTAPRGVANQEGLYWRYEMALRRMESKLGGITAGNGAINAIRREDYIALDPTRGQDISFPFELAKRGRRAVYEPSAIATEPMTPTIGGEFKRKRRMMAGAWNTILRTSLLSPRGYTFMYALQIYSHRLLRYVTPILHAAALGTNIVLLSEGPVYFVTLGLQAAAIVTAFIGGLVPWRPLRIARYYAAVTGAIVLGFWDFVRKEVPHTWESAEGTR